MKTLRVVLNLTVAGFLSVEVAAAEQPITEARELPRFRLGVEQTVLTFNHLSYKHSPATVDTVSWGFGGTDFTADYRVADGLELGVAAGVFGSHVAAAGPDGYGGSNEESITMNTIHVNPRASLVLPVARDLSLSPRLGVDYAHTSYDTESTFSSSWEETETALFVTPGVMLEYSPKPWLFFSTGPEAAYRMRWKTESGESGWFSEQGVRTWSVNWLLAAGVKI